MEESQKHLQRNKWFDFDMELPSPFQLEQAVCSHGLFMMPPNHWDPLSKTLIRPLRSSPSSFLVSLSQHSQSLAVRVHATHALSPQQQNHITVPNSLCNRFFCFARFHSFASSAVAVFRLRFRECCVSPKRKRRL